MARSRALTAFAQGTRATFGNLTTVIPVVVAMGFIAAVADKAIYDALAIGEAQDQGTLVKVLFAWMGVSLAQEVLLGPIIGAIAVYVGRIHSAGESAGLYESINFALGRYSRLFLPRMIAQLSIQIGLMLLLFPGVIYVTMYAFVDSVACLEQKVWPIDRSKRLTRGRRASIVGIYLPVALLVQVVALAELWALQQGVVTLALVFILVFLLFFIVDVAFYKLYEERTTSLGKSAKVAEASADTAAEKTAPADPAVH